MDIGEKIATGEHCREPGANQPLAAKISKSYMRISDQKNPLFFFISF